MAKCSRCAQLEADLRAERARVDRYADILFRVGAQKEGVPVERETWAPTPPAEPLPPVVERAIGQRSAPTDPLRHSLMGRAREQLAAGVNPDDVAAYILDGEEVDL